jgi:hypothetical protein
MCVYICIYTYTHIYIYICKVTVHYIPIIDLIIFLSSGRTFSRVTDKPLNKLKVIWNYVKGCVVITSHVVFIYLKNNQ